MRKFFVTLLTVSLLAGLFLSGTMSAMAMPASEKIEAAAVDCPDHAQQPKPMDHKSSGHSDTSCCMSGHCPMLVQALMPPEALPQPSPVGSLLRPILVSLQHGIVDSPHLRPPRHFL